MKSIATHPLKSILTLKNNSPKSIYGNMPIEIVLLVIRGGSRICG
jgi:hypothetical protein